MANTTEQALRQQPVSGAMTDAEFLSKRLARVARLAGVPMPDFSHEGIAEVAGTILGQIASKLEFDRAQDAQAVRNAALEEAAKIAEKPFQPFDLGGDLIIDRSQRDAIACAIRKLQSAPSQHVERPDAVELPPLPAPLSTVEAWVTQDYGRKTSNEILEANDEYYTADQMRDYALAAITANQPQVRGKAQEPVAYRIPNERGKFDYYGFCDTISVEAMKNAETLYAAAPQVAQEEGARTVIKQCITLAQKRLLEPPSEFREIDFINALGWIRDRLKEVLAAPQPDAQQSSEKDARMLEIGKAVERACEVLPEGFDLHIELERGAGIVRLYLPDSDACLDDFSGDTFAWEINKAIDSALAKEQGR